MSNDNHTLRIKSGVFEFLFQRSVRKGGELYIAVDGHGGYISDNECLKLFHFLLNNGVAGFPKKSKPDYGEL